MVVIEVELFVRSLEHYMILILKVCFGTSLKNPLEYHEPFVVHNFKLLFGQIRYLYFAINLLG